jgi:hypothetical protein
MAAWDKDIIFVNLVTTATGADDVAAYTVKFQPIDQAFPTGATAGVQCSATKARWQPASDLDDTKHYDVYVGSDCVGRLFSLKSEPPIGA